MHYADFARAMADYLETRGVLDVVPSDILAGFLVLQQVQHRRRLQMRHEVLSEQFTCSNPSISGFANTSSTQLKDHRANAKSLNGMQLLKSSSQDGLSQHLLRGQHESSSNSLIDGPATEALLKPPQQRPVLLQSMGSGSIHNLDLDNSKESGSW